MKLSDILEEKKEAILAGWLDEILSTYPLDAAKIYKKNKDRFANPVGQTFAQAIPVLFDELRQGTFSDKLTPALEEIVKIRAVQDFTPAQAIGIILSLKKVIRAQAGGGGQDPELLAELVELDSRIDELVLRAVNIYVWCREKVFEIKAREAERRTHMLLRRAQMEFGSQEQKSGDQGTNII